MTDDAGGVRITNREIYDALLSLQRTVEHLSGQVIGGNASVADHESRLRVIEVNQAFPKHAQDHERRIRFLEKVTWGIPASLVIAVTGLVLKVAH